MMLLRGGKYNEYGGTMYWSYANHKINDVKDQILIRGNNDWSLSNIRTWLNSADEAVKYNDQAPTKAAIGDNSYDEEAGFLYGFTAEEKAALITVTNQTPGNSTSNNGAGGMVTTEDKVYLLSSAELEAMIEAGLSPYAKPSDECQKHDELYVSYEAFVKNYKVENYYWWLRDNSGEEANRVYIATTEFEEDAHYVSATGGLGTYGVRPVICVNKSFFE